ncbi:SRPBCC family protein [Leptolyngbya sp. 7M]|uniref:SRPBCC family protein n=1 Tax=Leptolyngbya sp. 7M TaxID=2812896 RepID=UPI001B8B5A91|nr:SRPBCC family protein [Leptolyngbya sp. 7M]QYO67480.1 SRPBCC family protein [Leptolyngbya sp. 7M]
MFKKILIALGGLLLLFVVGLTFAILLAPTEFAVEREIVINKPRSEVFEYVRKLRNQNEWGPWFKREPTMHQEFRGTDGEPGFTVGWKSELESGVGEQEIKHIVENERIETELRFKDPFESNSDSYIITEAVDEDRTKVKWGMKGSMPRPFNVFGLVMNIESAIGKDYEEGLASLKSILEK